MGFTSASGNTGSSCRDGTIVIRRSHAGYVQKSDGRTVYHGRVIRRSLRRGYVCIFRSRSRFRRWCCWHRCLLRCTCSFLPYCVYGWTETRKSIFSFDSWCCFIRCMQWADQCNYICRCKFVWYRCNVILDDGECSLCKISIFLFPFTFSNFNFNVFYFSVQSIKSDDGRRRICDTSRYQAASVYTTVSDY